MWIVNGQMYIILKCQKESPFLQLVDPRTDQVLDIDVEEGDVLSFPSFVTHRSPDMESDTRKTIISCNSCADIAEEDYI